MGEGDFMFSIKAAYRKGIRCKMMIQNLDTDSYDQAMLLFETYLKKHGIHEKDILSYEVIKTIKCNHCDETVTLTSTKNVCSCGTAYDFIGNEITPHPAGTA